MIDTTQIEKHMEVVGADGQHVGTVDCVGIKTTKNDPAAHDQHHFFKLEMIDSVADGKVKLTMSASEAFAAEKMVEN